MSAAKASYRISDYIHEHRTAFNFKQAAAGGLLTLATLFGAAHATGVADEIMNPPPAAHGPVAENIAPG